MSKKFTLVVAVEYAGIRGKSEAEVARTRLYQMVERAAGEGLLSSDDHDFVVASWEAQVALGHLHLLRRSAVLDLKRLLDYAAREERRHYEESRGVGDATRGHIWHSIRRLAKVLGYAL